MAGRGNLVSLFLLVLSSTARAVVPGPATQLSFGPNDSINPAISGNWVVWTTDTGQPNALDIYALDRANGATSDVTPRAGDQFLDDVDGHFAAYLDDSGAFVTVMVKDLAGAGAPLAVNVADQVNGSHPAVQDPNGGPDWRLVYVRGGAHPDVVFVPDQINPPITLTTGLDGGDLPRLSGDWVVFQAHAPNEVNRHIYAWSISKGGAPVKLTDGADDTSPDTDGTNVVFTRGGTAILSVPVGGGAAVQLSAVGAPGTRDRAHISGGNVVWDDHRNGLDCDVYWSAPTGGGDQLLVGGAGDQFLTDLDGNDVVYTAGPVGGPHNVFLVKLVACNANADCPNHQVCVANACQPCTLNAQCAQGEVCLNGQCGQPQCVGNNGCVNGQVCVNNACVPCTSDLQCNQGLVCKGGACVAKPDPPKTDPDGCGNGTAIATVELVHNWQAPAAAWGAYQADPNHTYWVCVVNGDGDPKKKTSTMVFANNLDIVLTPADFKPNNNPPSLVTKTLHPWKFLKWQIWSAALFGPHPPEAVKIKIMQSN